MSFVITLQTMADNSVQCRYNSWGLIEHLLSRGDHDPATRPAPGLPCNNSGGRIFKKTRALPQRNVYFFCFLDKLSSQLAILVRVLLIYHDIGKKLVPTYMM